MVIFFYDEGKNVLYEWLYKEGVVIIEFIFG